MFELSDVGRLIEVLIGAGAVYGGIRADLKHILKSLDEVKESVSLAHRRIDAVILKKVE
jgi:hypothetical protein